MVRPRVPRANGDVFPRDGGEDRASSLDELVYQCAVTLGIPVEQALGMGISQIEGVILASRRSRADQLSELLIGVALTHPGGRKAFEEFLGILKKVSYGN